MFEPLARLALLGAWVAATLAQARDFLAQKHLPAAANYARSACELLLRKTCEKLEAKFPYKSNPAKISFEQLKMGIIAHLNLEHKTLLGQQPRLSGDPVALARNQAAVTALKVKQAALTAIEPYQIRILNPLVHDPTTPLNQAEVVAAIDAVEALMTAMRN